MPDTALSPAEAAAAAAQLKVSSCIDGGQHFRLEAGAGAGKTYSLVEALKRLIAERGRAYIQNGKKVACITYTKGARDEIASEIDRHPAIVVDTIHGFCWEFMSRFQSQLRELIPQISRNAEKVLEAGGLGKRRVDYNLGFFGIEQDVVTLYHDDIPEIMARLLDREKFRRLFTDTYPVLFIDEYQDTNRNFVAAIARHFLGGTDGPLVGLFGDHWQTIYYDDFVLIDYPNLVGIDKGANFRSVPAVVDVLNQLRPDLTQAVRDPNAVGSARVYHTNTYVGTRTDSNHSKGDLPSDLARKALAVLREKLATDGWDFSTTKTKVLMLTHNALGEELGYSTIVEVFKDRKDAFAKKEDRTIAFLLDMVEPMCRAYDDRRYGDMFHILGQPQSVKSHVDKELWKSDMATLRELRLHGKVGAVLDHLKETSRPRVPDPVMRREREVVAFDPTGGTEEPSHIRRQRALRDVPYAEVIELAKFVDDSIPFATQHSVKGAEFENVLAVFGGGWSKYNWPRMLELMQTGKLTSKTEKGFYRARNLFYVELSRPKQRLAVLFTQTLSSDAMATVERLFRKENVVGLTLQASVQ